MPGAMFLLWNFIILGSPLAAAGGDFDPLDALTSSESGAVIGSLVQAFSVSLLFAPHASKQFLSTDLQLFAVSTSYLGFCLGISDFIADYMKLPAGRTQFLPNILTVTPPLICSLLFPGIFFGKVHQDIKCCPVAALRSTS